MEIQKLAHTEWHYIHRRFRTPFYTYAIWDGASKHYDTAITFPYETNNFLYLDTEIAIAEDDWQEMGQRVSAALHHNPHFLIELLPTSYEQNQEVEKWARSIAKQDLSNWSEIDLISQWRWYQERLNRFGACILLPLFIEGIMEDQLKQAFTEHFSQDERGRVLQVLTTPIKPNATQQQEFALLRLIVKMRNGVSTNKDSDDYLEHFSWITNNAFNGHFMSKSELMKRIKDRSVHDPEHQYQGFLERNNQLKNQFTRYYHRFPSNIQQLIDTLQESIYYRSWRTERYYRNAYFLQGFFTKTASILKVQEPLDLFYCVFPEIIQALSTNKHLDYRIIKERKSGYAVLATHESTDVISGSELLKWQSSITLQSASASSVIKGQTAYVGQVSGIARVVISKDDLKKVKDGDILITPSTTIDYVPILRKVRAIVTDEGGVLSHASVISRELHIPCIIGTKTATQVLKDGDRVIVDANKGVVFKT